MLSTGRNNPCPCGSQKKYKQCCLKSDAREHISDSITNQLRTALQLQQSGNIRQAEAIYHQVLQSSPNHPDALHLLGLLARQEGNYQQAVDLIAKAAKINPVAPVYFNLGNAYQSLDDMENAIDSFRKALSIKPDYVAALNNLGIALQRHGDLEGAFSSFQMALSLQPNQAELLSNFGDVLRLNNQTHQARECLERSVTLAPTLPNAHLNLGKTLDDMGQTSDAIKCIEHALTLNPDHLDSLLALARIYADAGQFTRAQEYVGHILRLSPNNLEAWASLAFFKKMTLNDYAWAQQALLLLNIHPHSIDCIFLNYALGKYFDETQQYSRAFHHYSLANQAQKARNKTFDREPHHNSVNEIIRANTKASVRHHNSGANTSPRPIFIVGMPRSGTSLMEQILASHHDVFGAGELHFWVRKATENYASMSVWHESTDLLADLSKEFECEMNRRTEASLRFVDKMPANFLNLGLIHAAYPNARIIHMQRNPIDTCLSIYFQSFSEQHTYATDLDALAFYYQEYQRLMDHWRAILPTEIFLEVSYEELIENPEGWGRKAIEFIGLEWDENCLRFHDTDRKVGTASNWQVRQPIYSTSKSRWLKYQPFIAPLLSLLE